MKKQTKNAKIKVYISGPISGIDNYKEKFTAAEKALKAIGYTVLNPARIKVKDPVKENACAFKKAVRMLLDANRIFFLPGWINSKGAKIEWRIAQYAGIEPLDIKNLLRTIIK